MVEVRYIKAWPNGKLVSTVLARAILRLRLTTTCDDLRSLWLRSNLHLRQRKFFIVWPFPFSSPSLPHSVFSAPSLSLPFPSPFEALGFRGCIWPGLQFTVFNSVSCCCFPLMGDWNEGANGGTQLSVNY